MQNSESVVAMTHDGNYCEVFLQFRHSQFSAMLLINKLSICVSILGWSHMQSNELHLVAKVLWIPPEEIPNTGKLVFLLSVGLLRGRFPPSNVPIWTWCFTILKIVLWVFGFFRFSTWTIKRTFPLTLSRRCIRLQILEKVIKEFFRYIIFAKAALHLRCLVSPSHFCNDGVL